MTPQEERLFLEPSEADFRWRLRVNPHPPTVAWYEEYEGERWRDMCGKDEEMKKIHFALMRRGCLLEDDCESPLT